MKEIFFQKSNFRCRENIYICRPLRRLWRLAIEYVKNINYLCREFFNPVVFSLTQPCQKPMVVTQSSKAKIHTPHSEFLIPIHVAEYGVSSTECKLTISLGNISRTF